MYSCSKSHRTNHKQLVKEKEKARKMSEKRKESESNFTNGKLLTDYFSYDISLKKRLILEKYFVMN